MICTFCRNNMTSTRNQKFVAHDRSSEWWVTACIHWKGFSINLNQSRKQSVPFILFETCAAVDISNMTVQQQRQRLQNAAQAKNKSTLTPVSTFCAVFLGIFLLLNACVLPSLLTYLFISNLRKYALVSPSARI